MGGNVFQGTSDFDHSAIEEILKTVNSSLAGTGIEAIPVGSAATPTPGKTSGDLDVIVDEAAVMDYFDVRTPKDARKMLNDYIAQKGFETAQKGVNVHVRAKAGNNSHQVDIMVVPGASSVAQFHTHNIPTGSPYKGKHKQLLLYMLAKDKNMFWSAFQGLFAKDENGKKAQLLTNDVNKVAQLILGDGASASDLESVETILKKVPNPEQTLQRAEQDQNWTKVAESLADKNHNRLVELMKAMTR